MKVLAGDIGGTKTNLGIFEVSATNSPIHSVFELSYVSCDYASLEDIVTHFLAQYPETENIHNTCFGVAGPVIKQCCEVTNLPWIVSAKQLQATFSWSAVHLLNDLEANAWGIASLKANDFVTLNAGQTDASGNCAIIAAGTGLGEAGMFWNGEHHLPFATEGGHTDFSPSNDLEFRLQGYLSKKYQGHVSWERIVSGMGLVNLYEFLCAEANASPPEWLVEAMQVDAAAAISNAAMSNKDKLCQQALTWLVTLYGVEAGNQALKIMAQGGVYLGGGIAPKIISALQSGRFMQAFCNKGRMSHLMKAMPVKVIMNDKTALYGPAMFAYQNAHETL
ncbi:glucokinase [sulfur-oxidizing endosymbiont of Gigantopelta aegis]|uniref:glucokinase n=1 Tax=sulfur-oxidizing endosymbiont of Gigantopelta aegis TaxID=2794934 RepID=UPI0018DB6A94|nr:glucokinase [sulfur-oxidizing endosymbiont of Gigantopelta aegis]